jgi:hypothetical protein
MPRKPNPDGKFSLKLGAERRHRIEEWRTAQVGQARLAPPSLQEAVLLLVDMGLDDAARGLTAREG